MKKIPWLLIYSRLAMGFAILLLAFQQWGHYRLYITLLFIAGLLSDIFDGIIARRLNVSTAGLRRMDSTIDQVFFSSVAVAVYVLCPAFFQENKWSLAVLICSEVLAYAVCYLKFKKEIATHSIGAKIWTLLIFATLLQVIWQCQSGIVYTLCLWVGLLTRLEIIAILLTLKQWTNDVPSFYHALLLRQGKEITRNRLFNG